MDFVGTVSVPSKQCIVAGPPVWYLVRVCMFVPCILLICEVLLNNTRYTFLDNLFCSLSDTYGLFNYLLPGPSFYSSIEGSSMLVCFL